MHATRPGSYNLQLVCDGRAELDTQPVCEACCCVLSPRAKAVRLVANKLFTEPSLEDAVERFATAAVRELAAAPTPAAHAEDPSAIGNGVKLESASGAAPALAGAREGAAAGQGETLATVTQGPRASREPQRRSSRAGAVSSSARSAPSGMRCCARCSRSMAR